MVHHKDYKIPLLPFTMMVFTTVYGFANVPRAYFMMGYGAIFWYILTALLYFLPYAIMMVEFGSTFKREHGGIYTWMHSSLHERHAFMFLFMWYASYVIWQVTVSTIMWIPVARSLELFNFNGVLTPFINLLYNNSYVVGICAIVFVFLVKFAISQGLESVGRLGAIGGMGVIFLNFVLIVGALIVLIANKFQLAEPITGLGSFIINPHKDHHFVSIIGFASFALFAHGGLDVVSGLVDKVEHPGKTFPRGILLAAIVIACGYSLMIFMVGTFTNWLDVMNQKGVAVGNAIYVVMEELGAQIAMVFGMGPKGVIIMSKLYGGVAGLSVTATFVGAFFTLSYAPLKQMVEGTPRRIWPKFLLKENNDMPVEAIFIQGVVVAIMIALNAFGGRGVGEIMSRVIMMTNIAMTVPYIFVAVGYMGFRRNHGIKKNLLLVKNDKVAIVMAIVVILFVGIVNIFAVLHPLISGSRDGNFKVGLIDTLVLAAGPVLFCLLGYLLDVRSLRKVK